MPLVRKDSACEWNWCIGVLDHYLSPWLAIEGIAFQVELYPRGLPRQAGDGDGNDKTSDGFASVFVGVDPMTLPANLVSGEVFIKFMDKENGIECCAGPIKLNNPPDALGKITW